MASPKERIEQILNRIRPAIQQDGGNVELDGCENGIVKIRLTGDCSSCASTKETLSRGIERAIQAEVPEIQSVEFKE